MYTLMMLFAGTCYDVVDNYFHVAALAFLAKCSVTGEKSNSVIILYCTGSRYLATSNAKL